MKKIIALVAMVAMFHSLILRRAQFSKRKQLWGIQRTCQLGSIKKDI